MIDVIITVAAIAVDVSFECRITNDEQVAVFRLSIPTANIKTGDSGVLDAGLCVVCFFEIR